MTIQENALIISIKQSDGQILLFTDKDLSDNMYRSGIEIEYMSRNLGTGNQNMAMFKIPSTMRDQINFVGSTIKVNQMHSEEILYSGICIEIINKENEMFILCGSHLMALTKSIGTYYSAICRANLGDSKCGKNLQQFTFTGKVIEMINKYSFVGDHDLQENGFFNYGILEFGQKKYRISISHGRLIEIFPDVNIKIEVNDLYTITAGCNKSIDHCVRKFNNATNFRGEPYILKSS